jgi:hypothetical protein
VAGGEATSGSRPRCWCHIAAAAGAFRTRRTTQALSGTTCTLSGVRALSCVCCLFASAWFDTDSLSPLPYGRVQKLAGGAEVAAELVQGLTGHAPGSHSKVRPLLRITESPPSLRPSIVCAAGRCSSTTLPLFCVFMCVCMCMCVSLLQRGDMRPGAFPLPLFCVWLRLMRILLPVPRLGPHCTLPPPPPGAGATRGQAPLALLPQGGQLPVRGR